MSSNHTTTSPPSIPPLPGSLRSQAGGRGRLSFARTLALLAALSVLVVALSGCPRRQQIIEQTVRARAQDVAAELEASYVPEELLTWEMVAEIDPRFDSATAVAFDARDALYVAGDQAVRKFDSAGQVQWEMPVGGKPTCLAVGSTDARAGPVYVGLKERVEVLIPGGENRTPIVPEGNRTWITSIAVGESLFVADAGNRRVLRYDVSASPKGEIAGKDQERGIPALAVPSPHLDIDITGDDSSASSPPQLVVANPGHRSIQYHSLDDGALLKSWGEASNAVEGFGGCCNPTDIALLPDGRVVTSEKGLPRVKVYSDEGKLLSVVVPPDDFLPPTAGIDVDADSHGRIAVLDPQRNLVRLYEESAAAEEASEQ